jgi:hypothetical protein
MTWMKGRSKEDHQDGKGTALPSPLPSHFIFKLSQKKKILAKNARSLIEKSKY